MEDHLKNQAIRAQLESKINETQTSSTQTEASKKISLNDDIPKEIGLKIVESWGQAADSIISEEPEAHEKIEDSTDQIVLGENEFRPFMGPDLSKLPKEIPIPGDVPKLDSTYALNIPKPGSGSKCTVFYYYSTMQKNIYEPDKKSIISMWSKVLGVRKFSTNGSWLSRKLVICQDYDTIFITKHLDSTVLMTYSLMTSRKCFKLPETYS